MLVLDLATKKAEPLATEWKSLKGLAWDPQGEEIWFGGSKISKRQNINAVSLSRQLRQNVYELPGVYCRVEDISDDGRILITQGSAHSTMTILEGNSASDAVSSQFAWTTSADLSADGKTLLYYEWGYEAADSSEDNTVLLRKLDSSELIRLGPGKALALSGDGNWALALQNKPQLHLALLSTSTREARNLTNPGMKEYHYASFYPDGRHILFTAVETRDDASLRSYVQDIDTGEVRPLTDEGTVALRVSPDGKSVVTLQPDQTFYIQPLNGGEPTPIRGLESKDEPIQWSDDGRALYVIGAGEFATKIYRVDIATGRRRSWKEIDPLNKVGLIGLEVNPGGILITPDGRVCVYTYWTTLQYILM